MRRRLLPALLATGAALRPGPNIEAAQESSYSVTIHDDRFEPSTLHAKALVKFRLHVKNARQVAAGFESSKLGRETVVPAGQSAVIFTGPLSPGASPFFADFQRATRGRMVAKWGAMPGQVL